MKGKISVIGVAFAVVLLSMSAFAHHPFSAEYDWKKPVTLDGTVTNVNWSNPHVTLTIEGKSDTGRAGTWTIELGNITPLSNAGWKKDSLKARDHVIVDAWLARDGSMRANAKSVKMPNGQELDAGSSILSIPKPAGKGSTN